MPCCILYAETCILYSLIHGFESYREISSRRVIEKVEGRRRRNGYQLRRIAIALQMLALSTSFKSACSYTQESKISPPMSLQRHVSVIQISPGRMRAIVLAENTGGTQRM
jgi:hypothetical protein